MKVYTHEVDQKEVILDMNIRLAGHILHFRPVSGLPLGVIFPCSHLPLTSTVHFAVTRVTWTLTPKWNHQSQLVSRDLKWASHLSVTLILVILCVLCFSVKNCPESSSSRGWLGLFWSPLLVKYHLLEESPFFSFAGQWVLSDIFIILLWPEAMWFFMFNTLLFQTLEINWTGMTNLLDSPAFRLVSTES